MARRSRAEAGSSASPTRPPLAEILRAVSDLFRGFPLVELADDAFSLRVEAFRLEELRLAATKELLDARHATGEASEVVIEAELLAR